MSASEFAERTRALGSAVEELLAGAGTNDVDEATAQALLQAAVRLYAAKVDRNGRFPAVAEGTLSATDAMVTTTALLRSVNVQVFELGLWQTWAG
jgi:hypothetical protein